MKMIDGEAIGISFGITSSSTGVGASILHERDSSGSQGSLQFYTNGDGSNVAERMRIDSTGRLLVGHTSARSHGGIELIFKLLVLVQMIHLLLCLRFSNNVHSPYLVFAKSRGGAVGTDRLFKMVIVLEE